ncbi:MAG: DUF4837 family protein [Saprospiraceae bacterium]|nr:DUF4837 family protein [Saprospiraceae bacterium]
MNSSKIIALTKFFVFSLAVLFGSISCTQEARETLRATPLAFGDVNSLAVITDKSMWEGPVGDTIRSYYASAYLILPQPEPMFDLLNFSPEDLKAVPPNRERRHYLIVANLSDMSSPTTQLVLEDIGSEGARRAKEDPTYSTVVGRDKWAKGQLLVYQFAHSDDVLIENIKKNFPAIGKRINKADESKIDATLFIDGENQKLLDEVRQKLEVEIRIPKDYFLALSNNDIIWIRKETQKYSSNLMLKKLKYTDQAQLSREGIKAVTDSIGRKYVSSQLPDTYMKINDVDLPMFVDAKTINGKYALEARGIWEMENDFMGGPFISYLFHNPDKGELLFVEGFVYAPGEDKRDIVQNLEYLISSVKF